MKKPTLILALFALSLNGCGETLETSSNLNAQETYSTTSSDYSGSSLYSGSTSSSLNSNTTNTTNAVSGSTWPTSGNPVSSSSQATATVDPLAGTGISATLADQKNHSWFSRNLDAKIQLVNHDAVPRGGYVIVTFSTVGAQPELQYRYVSLDASGNQALTVSSTKPADSAMVEFRRKFL